MLTPPALGTLLTVGECMLKLVERNITCLEERLVVLAPPQAAVSRDVFPKVSFDSQRHQRLVQEMQRLRGSVYLADGAVEERHLTSDGLHSTPEDSHSWHLLMLSKEGYVNACVWYREHSPWASMENLRMQHSPLALEDESRDALKRAVDSEIEQARRDQLTCAEVGGWAVSQQSRCTSEGLLLALAAYSLGRFLGGAVGFTTATVRHCSSTILRRLGGRLLEVDGQEIPAYYDPKYKCHMELLRFDSRRPNPKYRDLIDMISAKLSNVAVIACDLTHDGVMPEGATPAYAAQLA